MNGCNQKVSKLAVLAIAAITMLAGCNNDARVVSKNVSTDADNFKIMRRVVFYNAIQDKYILEMEGYCSIQADQADQQLETLCKTGPSTYQKNILGYSDNVTYTVEQLESSTASPYHYKMIFKPQSIVPFQNVEVR